MKNKSINEVLELLKSLTEYTIPFEYEDLFVKNKLSHLPLIKDEFGNYYMTIGDSNTMFVSHLDTYSKNYEKVNHVFDGKRYLKTNGKTILGADNKAGVACLLHLIENNIPGLYYFFIGEEPILSGGLYGSMKLAMSELNEPNITKNITKCIAFDRKSYGSIIYRQYGSLCCSKEFAQNLANQFNQLLKLDNIFKLDPGGYYTDSYSFVDLIPECTNISTGVHNEHMGTEYIDLLYFTALINSLPHIDWEDLEIYRTIDECEMPESTLPLLDTYTDDDYLDMINSTITKYGFMLSHGNLELNTNLMYSLIHEDFGFFIKVLFVNNKYIIYFNSVEIELTDLIINLENYIKH